MMRISLPLRRGLAALSALALTACATSRAPAPQTGGKPALWKLADADTTIYLFGTIHLLPKGLDWRTPVLDQALASADTLVLETGIGSDPMAAAQVMMKLGFRSGLPPILERVAPEKRPQLQKMIADTGVPGQSLDRMETWAAALTLLATSFRQMGLASEEGVEMSLDANHRRAGKPVIGLETPEQQFGFFDSLSEDSQRALLSAMIDDPARARAEFQAMLDAWTRGDITAIARTFDSETALSPELRDVLMKRRNAAWADWLAKRLDQPGTVLVAVGAGHLAGSDSVQTMLRAKGLKPQRIQ